MTSPKGNTMTNKNLIERLRETWLDTYWHEDGNAMLEEAAALIEQQEAVIASLIGALEQIAFSGITDRDKLTASAVDYIDGGGKYPNERTVAAYALLAAKTQTEDK